MEKSTVEQLFKWFEKTTEIIQAHMDEPYLDSLSEVMDTVFFDSPNEEFNDILTKKLNDALDELGEIKYSTTDLKKALQLAILKGMKDSVQEQHVMTPESIGLIVAYLADQLMKNKQEIRIFDPAGGTGNLLFTVMEQLSQKQTAYASEVDPTQRQRVACRPTVVLSGQRRQYFAIYNVRRRAVLAACYRCFFPRQTCALFFR